jgi:hypothetical protein
VVGYRLRLDGGGTAPDAICVKWTPAQAGSALEQLLQTMSTEDAELVGSILEEGPLDRPADEACRAARLLHGGLPQIPEGPRLVLARWFVAP